MAIRQQLAQALGHPLGVGHERVDGVAMTDGEVVVEIEVAVVDGDHRAAAVVDRRQRQLDPVVGDDDAGP